MAGSETGLKGIAELETVFGYLAQNEPANEVVFDPTLARGLSYYTGCIFEVRALGAQMGSIGGGGRYDDLTGIFGLANVSGVGVSFGAERIYDVMEELELFPASLSQDLALLFVAFDEETHLYAFRRLALARAAGVSADLFPETAKVKKQKQ